MAATKMNGSFRPKAKAAIAGPGQNPTRPQPTPNTAAPAKARVEELELELQRRDEKIAELRRENNDVAENPQSDARAPGGHPSPPRELG